MRVGQYAVKIIVILGFTLAAFSMPAYSQGDMAPKKSSGKGAITWKLEPTSVIGVLLDHPLTASAEECARGEPVAKLCFYRNNPLEVCCVGVEPFRNIAYVRTSDTHPEGKVGSIEMEFESSDFKQVADILVVKYGRPHKREMKKVKTRGGAEFESVEMSWVGANVGIVATSLSTRFYSESERRLIERGSVVVWTKAYARKEAATADDAARKGAGKL